MYAEKKRCSPNSFEDTCVCTALCSNPCCRMWPDNQGSPQFIIMDFKKGVVPTELSFTFQGGFVGTNCSVYGTPPGDAEQQKLCEIYPEDVNTEQRFQLDALPASVPSIQMLEIRFDSSTDFYGRVTVYNLNVLG